MSLRLALNSWSLLLQLRLQECAKSCHSFQAPRVSSHAYSRQKAGKSSSSVISRNKTSCKLDETVFPTGWQQGSKPGEDSMNPWNGARDRVHNHVGFGLGNSSSNKAEVHLSHSSLTLCGAGDETEDRAPLAKGSSMKLLLRSLALFFYGSSAGL